MKFTKGRGYELLTTGTAVSIPAAATAQSQTAILTPVDIALWTLDSQGNALVKMHDGSIQSLTYGTFISTDYDTKDLIAEIVTKGDKNQSLRLIAIRG